MFFEFLTHLVIMIKKFSFRKKLIGKAFGSEVFSNKLILNRFEKPKTLMFNYLLPLLSKILQSPGKFQTGKIQKSSFSF